MDVENLEYTARFKRSDLVNDVAEKLRARFGLDIGESRAFALEAIAAIRLQGNSALYSGVVNECLKFAEKSYTS
ncbi:hypothetical protein J4466_03520 [Candidatus Pacearchaeota archaeon]|nr:hypothetical protein [Candidatus Pacearchaeota archaeon]